ncbi:hypothetical protein [uncultured Mediterranean phage uvMED]|jgi:hypothetical protein|nr:hypothetical protein [uncultured Mediterranean phage uvMED]|tara:strand:+ start:2630 stop:2842 length:213 start_codon:yes stop_codon:yes gene_type:complete
MCFFKSPKMVMPEPKVDPEIEKQKAEEKKRQEAEKKKQEEFKKKTSAGQVGKRSLISGQSGGIGYYKDPM